MAIGKTKELTLIFLFSLFAAGCDHGTSYRYSTYAEAKKDPTVVGASIPDFMPKSATDIYGWYHVELNEQTVEFTFAHTDQKQLVSLFKPISSEMETTVKADFFRRSWKTIAKESSFSFYVKQNVSTVEYLAIDTTSSRSYYWIKRE